MTKLLGAVSDAGGSAPVRWGIMATGRIADSFAADLALVPDQSLAAVGSRRHEAAAAFAATHGAARAHGSYEALASDPEVDVVYVASPHSRHVEDVLLCFEHGKSVLCEKPVAMNGDDARRLVDEARRRGLFFAEAMWMRVNPAIRRIREMVRSGSVGDVGVLKAELGFAAGPEIARLWDPELGASALLDMGIYPLTFAHLMLGEPESITTAGTLSDRGIDVAGAAVLTYANGAVASIDWSQRAWTDNRATIAGDGGRIEVVPPFHHPDDFSYAYGESNETISLPRTGAGYAHEIEETGACLREGRTESDLLPLDETVAIMRQMDRMLEQLGVAPR